jgi:hypothetical protein
MQRSSSLRRPLTKDFQWYNQTKGGTVKGYIEVLQWYAKCKSIEELNDTEQHTGDAKSIDQLLGFKAPDIMPEAPKHIPKGYAVLRVEDDGKLTFVNANWDSSD